MHHYQITEACKDGGILVAGPLLVLLTPVVIDEFVGYGHLREEHAPSERQIQMAMPDDGGEYIGVRHDPFHLLVRQAAQGMVMEALHIMAEGMEAHLIEQGRRNDGNREYKILGRLDKAYDMSGQDEDHLVGLERCFEQVIADVERALMNEEDVVMGEHIIIAEQVGRQSLFSSVHPYACFGNALEDGLKICPSFVHWKRE